MMWFFKCTYNFDIFMQIQVSDDYFKNSAESSSKNLRYMEHDFRGSPGLCDSDCKYHSDQYYHVE